MGSQLKGQLNRIKGNLRMTTTRRPLLRAHRRRTLEVSTLDEDEMEEETGSSVNKNPRHHALLTDEILDHILSYVSARDLKSCRRVNKHWNSVATARWKKSGVILKVGGCWSGSLMDFVNYSQANGSSGRTRVTTPPILLDNISGLFAEIRNGNLVENPATIPAFAALCQSHLKTLKLEMHLHTIQKDYQARVQSIKQLLTIFLANLEHLALDFDDSAAADIILNPAKLQLERPINNSTKLKWLEILHYKSDEMHTGFEKGLLAELLRESHDLEHLVLEQSRHAWNTDSPFCCYKMLFNLLNSSTGGGGKLTKVRQLALTFNRNHPDRCRFCNAHARVNNGEAEVQQGPLFPNSCLQSLSFSRIPSKQMLNTLRHHQNSLLRLTIGPPHDVVNGADDDSTHAVVCLPNLREFNARARLSDKFFTSLLTLFPQLGSVGLTNPTAEQLRFVWAHFVQLHTLGLHFVENSAPDNNSSASTSAQDPQTVNIMHLDSLLSGFSINSCELIYTKIAADSSILTKSLSQPPPLLARSNTILNLAKLRRLEIVRTSSDLYPVRLTEVGLVLVILKLGSLTQLTLNWCTMLLPGTMSLIKQHVSPAMSLSINQQPNCTINDLGQANGMWL